MRHREIWFALSPLGSPGGRRGGWGREGAMGEPPGGGRGGGAAGAGGAGPPRGGAGGGAGAYDTVYTNAKAGMEGVDRERVRQVVLEASRGSAHFAREQVRYKRSLSRPTPSLRPPPPPPPAPHVFERTALPVPLRAGGADPPEQEKNRQAAERAEVLRGRAAALTGAELAEHQARADEAAAELELSRDLSSTWLHVDMDMFYAAVEIQERPELARLPFAVGGMGMISTTNYEARKFGVRSAMPGFIGKKLCPDLVFVRPRFDAYRTAAEHVRAVLRRFDPDFISVGLDEAYVNVTDRVAQGGTPAGRVAEELRACVKEATGLTCSVGAAPNRRLAKVCSDVNKPDGLFVLPGDRAAVLEFVRDLPVRKVGGIGRVSEKILGVALGVRTCGDLWERRAAIRAVWTPSAAAFYLQVALGLGSCGAVEGEGSGARARKGMSCERTFRSVSGFEALGGKLREVCDGLGRNLKKGGLRGRHLTLKLKTSLFEVKTRCRAMQAFTDCPSVVYDTALALLREELAPRPQTALRLLGVRMAQFEGDDCAGQVAGGGGQLTLTQALRGEGVDREGEEEPSGGRGGNWGGEATYECSLCGCTVLQSEQALHEDFHVAQELQKREDALEREQFEARQARRAEEINRRAGASGGGGG